ncbi:hypothetical protein [Phycicoccus sp. Soil802]|uniref:hypothetical protein n=1 Tax=Phycicoccus sp. Soil802 TaxID=1736414 RepID=UPI000A465803|nr:hypothetical protein [Phycicoccus sp. Soil802]
MSTTAPEYLTSLRDGFADAVQQWVDQSTTAWDQWQQAWSPVVEAAGLGMPGAPGTAPGRRSKGARGHGHGHDQHHEHGHDHHQHGHDHHEHGHDHHEHGHDHQGCGCHDRCGCGDVCDCCVPAADVIVHARAGEVRVVPFRLHNPWRREREVSLEVGPWHGCDGDDLEIRAVLEEEKVVLKPCEDRVVRLLVSTRGDGSSTSRSADVVDKAEPKDPASDAPTKPTKAAAAAAAARESVDVVVASRSRTADVDSCVSAYADVRFEGCARPQRVAVVVLPAECDAVDLGCDCGCCC